MAVLVKCKYNRTVVMLGDSITYGAAPGEVGRIQSQLQTLLGAGWTVINSGVSGAGTAYLLANFATLVTAFNPGYVIVWAGVNDGDSATIDDNLTSIYAAAAAISAKVIALTISPTKGNGTYWSESIQAVKDAVNSWILGLPANVDWALDAYTLLEDPEAPMYLLPAYRDAGYVHITTTAQDAVSAMIYSGVGDF